MALYEAEKVCADYQAAAHERSRSERLAKQRPREAGAIKRVERVNDGRILRADASELVEEQDSSLAQGKAPGVQDRCCVTQEWEGKRIEEEKQRVEGCQPFFMGELVGSTVAGGPLYLCPDATLSDGL